MILMMAIEQDWDDLNMAIAYFQKSMMRVRLFFCSCCSCSSRINFGWWLRNDHAC